MIKFHFTTSLFFFLSIFFPAKILEHKSPKKPIGRNTFLVGIS